MKPSTVNLTAREHAFYEAGKQHGRVEALEEVQARLVDTAKHYQAQAEALPKRKAKLVLPWVAGYQSFANQLGNTIEQVRSNSRAALTKAVRMSQPKGAAPQSNLRRRLARAIINLVKDP
jgi:flagellar biosynthesis chaperone FliJ